MLGYIISEKSHINIKTNKVHSFDVLHKTDLNIFVVKNETLLYKNGIIFNATYYKHIKVLEWFKKSGNILKIDKNIICIASKFGYVKILEWFKKNNLKLKFHRNVIVETKSIKILKFWCEHKIKNVILCIKNSFVLKRIVNKIFIKTIKFKTKHNYLKGYNKN